MEITGQNLCELGDGDLKEEFVRMACVCTYACAVIDMSFTRTAMGVSAIHEASFGALV